MLTLIVKQFTLPTGNGVFYWHDQHEDRMINKITKDAIAPGSKEPEFKICAGTPLIEAEHIPCYLCMKCVDVCSTGSLVRVTQEDTRMGLNPRNNESVSAYCWNCGECIDNCRGDTLAFRWVQASNVTKR